MAKVVVGVVPLTRLSVEALAEFRALSEMLADVAFDHDAAVIDVETLLLASTVGVYGRARQSAPWSPRTVPTGVSGSALPGDTHRWHRDPVPVRLFVIVYTAERASRERTG